ncbi:MAG TPA: hypothetical protein VFQ45_13345 [Longimicrobium sp.]|nr:hypothetical protein [Longimicrobium sp.]
MATGPDPNRFQPTDPEAEPEDYRRGDSLGDLRSTRLGLPTVVVTLIAVAIAVFVFSMLF